MKRLCLIILYLVSFSIYGFRKVVVVGGGLAGLSAAIEAHQNGAHVLLLDKSESVGGNSKKASSGINAACTSVQEENHVHDQLEMFAADTLKSGDGYSDEKLVETLVYESRDAWKFLSDLGVDLTVVSQTGGHSAARTHRAQQKNRDIITTIGVDIIKELSAYVGSCFPSIRVSTSSRVTQLLKEGDGVVYGLVYEKGGRRHRILCDAVILATGGFCGQTGNQSLLARWRPDLLSLSTTNGNCADGDGINLACSLGAVVVDMDKVQIHPTGFVHPHAPCELRKFLAPESLRASGGILLNHEGRRFTNELGKRDIVSNDILTRCKPYCVYDEKGPVSAYLVLNEDGARLFQRKVLDFYMRCGLIQQVSNASVLADFIGADREIVKQTLREYNVCSGKGCDSFGKTIFPVKKFSCGELLYVMIITPCLHYAMGGLKFNENAQVLGSNGPLENLYAAGEVTGGLHGNNRLCGNSLLECVVFGRRAGKNAALV
jgi:flavocytochrome c